MYPVSNAYRSSVQQQVINGCSCELTIFDIDQYAQSELTVGYDDAIWGSSANSEPSLMLRVPAPPAQKIATLEQGYMTASGEYALYDSDSPPWYYISEAMSGATPDENGEYPIQSSCKLRIGGTAESPAGNCTLHVDGIKRIRVTTDDGFEELQYTYIAEDGLVYIDCSAPDYNYPLDIEVLTLDRPNIRARVYSLFAGAADNIETWRGSDILSVSYTGTNDTVCLSLPSRTLTVKVVNRLGISAEQDIDNPRYTRLHTQAGLVYRYDLGQHVYEDIPTGRWYLDSYTITSDEITYNWIDALAVLNQETHYWCDNGRVTLDSRIEEIRHILPRAAQYFAGKKMRKTPAEIYGIKINTDAMNLPGLSCGAAPLVTYAAALQLYANVSGNRLGVDRDNLDDIVISPWPANPIPNPVMTLYRKERYGELTVSADDAYQLAVVTVHRVLAVTQDQTLATNEEIGYTDVLYNLNAPYAWIVSPDPSQLMLTPFDRCIYISAVDKFTPEKLTAAVYKVDSREEKVQIAPGSVVTALKSPLVDGVSITATDYATRLGGVLKYNVHYKIEHRGYPEIDEGDIIYVETESGVMTKCLVEENTWDITNGAKKGTTKVRRLK